jgi:flavodoxin I
MSKKTSIIYSFHTHKSKKVAEKVIESWGAQDIEPVNAEELGREVLEKYDNFILSAPTWFDGELPNYWDEFVPELEEMDLSGKKFAIFGLGDQKEYPENFCDAIGILAGIIENVVENLWEKNFLDGKEWQAAKHSRDTSVSFPSPLIKKYLPNYTNGFLVICCLIITR